VEASSEEQGDEGHEMQNISRRGGTANDERDMQQLGRTQQLNVSYFLESLRAFTDDM